MVHPTTWVRLVVFDFNNNVFLSNSLPYSSAHLTLTRWYTPLDFSRSCDFLKSLKKCAFSTASTLGVQSCKWLRQQGHTTKTTTILYQPLFLPCVAASPLWRARDSQTEFNCNCREQFDRKRTRASAQTRGAALPTSWARPLLTSWTNCPMGRPARCYARIQW